jgi:hypothetical protein
VDLNLADGVELLRREIAAAAPLCFPQSVASHVESDGRTVVGILRLVLGKKNGLTACRAQAAASEADPNIHGGVEWQYAGVDLLPHQVGHRFRHWVPPGGG